MQVHDYPIEQQAATIVPSTPVVPAVEDSFFPKGAVAFFVLLVLLGLVIWFGIYFLMLSRV